MADAAARPLPAGGLDSSECYAKLAPLLRSYLRRWVSPEDADDICQAALLDLWRTRMRYDPARSLDAWALMIARRRAIDYLRAMPVPTVPLRAVPEPQGEDGREVVARLADTALIVRALGTLPRPQREAIALAYYGGFSQREIAERLAVPVGTVKARTARGLRRARQLLISERP